MRILHDLLGCQARCDKTLAVDTKVRQVKHCILPVLQIDRFIFVVGF
jgi:hypothetical protein